jgi:thiol-disulfide isomerase/thioredoxin/DNA-binding beta-propeller fold protein YncE
MRWNKWTLVLALCVPVAAVAAFYVSYSSGDGDAPPSKAKAPPALAQPSGEPAAQPPPAPEQPTPVGNEVAAAAPEAPRDNRVKAPELEGGVEWLNTSGPIRLKDLRGKIVLLDFWTYCCINCIHVLPDLAKLEKKYPNQIVVIGVHSAKFDTEKDSKSIREAILRYNIEHPVVNDANHKIWRTFGVRSWPTLGIIDPEGYLFGGVSGEGNYELLEQVIEKLIKDHRQKKTLNEQPLHFDLAKFKERKEAPLYFPGKLLADAKGNRLFIADSSHHRIVITDLSGKKLDVIGTGEDGRGDGAYDKAQFNDPQGLALAGDTLYVADRKNHLLRAVDLKARTVRTVAGTGTQGRTRRTGGKGTETGLNSPWDLWLHDGQVYIAMAGHHQIWRYDPKTEFVEPFAGHGAEDLLDGTLARSLFAQPSGLTSDGEWLYVADSEVSAVRAVSLKEDGTVKTLVGTGLFDFGDSDGVGNAVLLQHCLGVAWHGGKVYVADTYNNKLKVIDPKTRQCDTFLGDGKPGREDNPPRFDEPAGLSIAGDQLYVADTNNHLIRVVDLKTKAVRTLKLTGLEPPRQPVASSKPSFPNAPIAKLAEKSIPNDGEVTVQVKLMLAAGTKLSPLAPISYLLEATEGGLELSGKVNEPNPNFEIKLPAEKLRAARPLKVSVGYVTCSEGGEGVCRPQSQVWEIPLKLDPAAKERVIVLETSGEGKAEKREP